MLLHYFVHGTPILPQKKSRWRTPKGANPEKSMVGPFAARANMQLCGTPIMARRVHTGGWPRVYNMWHEKRVH